LHFQIFGIPVRVHPWFWIAGVLLGLGGTGGKPGPLVIWVAVFFVSILVHELGHALAARAYGWPPRITLYGMGGMATYQPRTRDPKSEILILFAGPGAGFALALLVIGLTKAMGNEVFVAWGKPFGINLIPSGFESTNAFLLVYFLLFVNIGWGLVNLLPIYPLDGGQITRHTLNSLHQDGLRISLQISIAAAAVVAAYGLFELHDNFMALFFGYLSYSSYQALQNSGFGGGWR